MGQGAGARARAPCRTPASHSTGATGDPRDNLLAKEANQPQDPRLSRSQFRSKNNLPRTHASWVHRPGGHQQTPSCPQTAGTPPQRRWQGARGPGRRRSTCRKQQTGRRGPVGGDRSPHGGDSLEHDAKIRKPCTNTSNGSSSQFTARSFFSKM